MVTHSELIFDNRVGGASAPVMKGALRNARGPLPACTYLRPMSDMSRENRNNFVNARLAAYKRRQNHMLRVRLPRPPART